MHNLQNSWVWGIQVGVHFVEEYNPGLDAWMDKAPLNTQRLEFGAVYMDEGIWVPGGSLACRNATGECSTQ